MAWGSAMAGSSGGAHYCFPSLCSDWPWPGCPLLCTATFPPLEQFKIRHTSIYGPHRRLLSLTAIAAGLRACSEDRMPTKQKGLQRGLRRGGDAPARSRLRGARCINYCPSRAASSLNGNCHSAASMPRRQNDTKMTKSTMPIK